ncbi:MAG: molecular chaperone Skp [Ignavibacteria bacterium RIFOXYB2_FULL_35_12]|nr:MAG: molecular chaperone Skp [Ignavibacteria bacterium GWA2_36_19]OGU54425.1 MAG: molecular chaperone Skp [Ignavibacteria bacterium GWC2_35_8]OGU61255.1 MAG: molecular chaperone Skp [Ignavibacteria bacterium GWF2_35_20]OGU78893.1 MAG: molecular chaperone Skp [Ignavibacteria bacterium RIFOXYA2_FULL_35_9]OGU84327.1 MAG: molecular chaperone Skp [Ignavibacteria bacterium RIFOXYA12_FULL_35_25]OGU92261.1 MAG: molecular chaperone Skp [Ignavibacteria bacterium RIFOXYC12_FULL_35_11]OGU92898.1 MAG: 
MKRSSFLLFLFFILLTGLTNGQLKIGYVDSDSIMDKFPDAQDARQKLDAFIKDWQAELTKLETSWKTKYDDYEKRKLIMTDQTRAETESELIKLEQQIGDYREKKFGTNGELFQKQDEIMKPVQNKVFTAIKDVAKDEDLDFIFDRSGDVMLLFAKDEHDVTALVLEKLKLK